mmetsp:Transcript_43479/g.115416  ORF Transcript_43479/g.115416 Transcript_43479/m.115416 type:complete len:202 (-) Transcript_43479:102-707(-)
MASKSEARQQVAGEPGDRRWAHRGLAARVARRGPAGGAAQRGEALRGAGQLDHPRGQHEAEPRHPGVAPERLHRQGGVPQGHRPGCPRPALQDWPAVRVRGGGQARGRRPDAAARGPDHGPRVVFLRRPARVQRGGLGQLQSHAAGAAARRPALRGEGHPLERLLPGQDLRRRAALERGAQGHGGVPPGVRVGGRPGGGLH